MSSALYWTFLQEYCIISINIYTRGRLEIIICVWYNLQISLLLWQRKVFSLIAVTAEKLIINGIVFVIFRLIRIKNKCEIPTYLVQAELHLLPKNTGRAACFRRTRPASPDRLGKSSFLKWRWHKQSEGRMALTDIPQNLAQFARTVDSFGNLQNIKNWNLKYLLLVTIGAVKRDLEKSKIEDKND